MARMSIDDMLGRDPRLFHLAEILGWSRREAAGCLVLDVWPICYDRVTPVLPEREIDRAANFNGFAHALVESGLGRRPDPERPELVHVAGVAARIKYLLKLQQSAADAGKRSGEARRNARRARQNDADGASGNMSESQANSDEPSRFKKRTVAVQKTNGTANLAGNPSASASASAVSSPIAIATAGVGDSDKRAPASRDSDSGSDQHRRVVDAFHQRFLYAYGKAPTWRGAAGGRSMRALKELREAHGADEVIRRIGIMFDAPPSWLRPPFTVSTLASNFDRLLMRSDNTRELRGVEAARDIQRREEALENDRDPWDD